jgi:hypothetical protein
MTFVPSESPEEKPTYEEIERANKVLATNLAEERRRAEALDRKLMRKGGKERVEGAAAFEDRYNPQVYHHVRVMRGDNQAPYAFLAAEPTYPGVQVVWDTDVALKGPYLEVMDHTIETRYRDQEREDKTGIDHVPYKYQRIQYQYFGPVSLEKAKEINSRSLVAA